MLGEHQFEYSTGSHLKPASLRIFHRDNRNDRSCIFTGLEAHNIHSQLLCFPEGEKRAEAITALYETYATTSESQNQTKAAP